MRLVVATTSNGAVRGSVGPHGVTSFKGLSYAAAPVGDRYLAPPAPVPPWRGVRDALAFGPTVPKAPYLPPFDTLIPENTVPGDDYLNLNVWTPGLAGRAPVMVWLHGGAFTNGSNSVPCYDGTGFARDGVVLATVNYRLGAQGFLYLDDGLPANLGLLDQVAALGWIRENIAAFGGDPGNVTVFGESAGAMSIGTLLAVPAAAGLFRRAILQSGAAHHTLDIPSARVITRRIAEMLGIEPTRRALRELDARPLLAAQQELRAEIAKDPDPARWGRSALNVMPFEPVIDGALVPRDPAEVLAAGAGHDVDVLVGCNTDEYRLITVPAGVFDALPLDALRLIATRYGVDPDTALALYRESDPDASPGELHARMATDWFYRIPALRMAEAAAARRPGSAFVYEFAWRPPTYGGKLGACHGAEVPFVFGNLDDGSFTPMLGRDLPRGLSDAVHAAWVSFARTGDPGWPAYDVHRRSTMIFDLVPRLVEDPRPRERELWEGVRG